MSIQWDRPQREDTPAVRLMKDVMNEVLPFYDVKAGVLDGSILWAYRLVSAPAHLASASTRERLNAPRPLVMRFRDIPDGRIRLDTWRWPHQRNPLADTVDMTVDWGMPDRVLLEHDPFQPAKDLVGDFASSWRQFMFDLPREDYYQGYKELKNPGLFTTA